MYDWHRHLLVFHETSSAAYPCPSAVLSSQTAGGHSNRAHAKGVASHSSMCGGRDKDTEGLGALVSRSYPYSNVL